MAWNLVQVPNTVYNTRTMQSISCTVFKMTWEKTCKLLIKAGYFTPFLVECLTRCQNSGATVQALVTKVTKVAKFQISDRDLESGPSSSQSL